MSLIEHSFPMCTVCGMPHNGYEGPCLEPGCPGRVTWETTADRLYQQLQGAVERIAELEADLERERLARRMVDQALRDALARADAGGQ